MTTKQSIRELVRTQKPLVQPLAHDALTARLIERAGFKAVAIGGSSLLAARYGLPDIGLAALGEMAAGIGDIVAATGLPVSVDGDDGYGDAKSVIHMVELYARMGVSSIVLEDQVRVSKQPGDSGAVAVVSVDVMTRKIAAAKSAAGGEAIQLVARCDAYQLEGLAGAMRRAEAYLKAGADGLFIPAVPTVPELAEIGRNFRGNHLMNAMFEGRKTWLPPAEYYAMGFNHVVFPGAVISRVTDATSSALRQLADFAAGSSAMTPLADAAGVQSALEEAVRFNKWKAAHKRFAE